MSIVNGVVLENKRENKKQELAHFEDCLPLRKHVIEYLNATRGYTFEGSPKAYFDIYDLDWLTTTLRGINDFNTFWGTREGRWACSNKSRSCLLLYIDNLNKAKFFLSSEDKENYYVYWHEQEVCDV